MIACLVFGAAEAFEFRMQSFGLPISSYIVQMAPFDRADRARGLGRGLMPLRSAALPVVNEVKWRNAKTCGEC